MNTAMVEGGVNTAKPFNVLSTSTNDEVGMNTAISLTDLKLDIAARGLLDAVVISGDAVVHYHSCNDYEAKRATTTDHDLPSTAHGGHTNYAEQLTTTTGTTLYDKSAATNMRPRAASSNDDERAHEGHVICTTMCHEQQMTRPEIPTVMTMMGTTSKDTSFAALSGTVTYQRPAECTTNNPPTKAHSRQHADPIKGFGYSNMNPATPTNTVHPRMACTSPTPTR